jgi:hypothetical protein
MNAKNSRLAICICSLQIELANDSYVVDPAPQNRYQSIMDIDAQCGARSYHGVPQGKRP